MGSIYSPAHHIHIPRTTHYYVNPTIDLQTLNTSILHNEEQEKLHELRKVVEQEGVVEEDEVDNEMIHQQLLHAL
jgi:hypothetical protein